MADTERLLVNRTKEDVTDDGKPTTAVTPQCYLPCRYVLAALMMAGFTCAFADRMAFNIALVAMVNYTETEDVNVTDGDCPADTGHTNTTSISQSGDFNWDADLQASLLGAFYYGYPFSQLPFGYLAERFGGKFTLAFSGLSVGSISLLMPTAARWSPYALIALRALQGLGQGAIYPTCLAMLSRWGPPSERNSLFTFVNTGSVLGIIIGPGVSGFLCQSTFLGGWPATFYLFGLISILWSICWLLLVYDTPLVHPRISAAERNYILQETDGLATVKYTNPPWCAIMRCVPIWGILTIACTDTFGFYVTSSCMPLFMKRVLHFDISQDGVINALPSFLTVPVIIGVGILSDVLRKKGLLRVINIRRAAGIIGELLPGVFMLLIGFVGCNKVAAVCLLVLSGLTNTFLQVGPITAIFDIAPLYSGSIMGVLNGIGNLFGFVSPLVVAKVTDNSGDRLKWRTVFCITAVVYAVGALVFCATLTDKEQTWARDKGQGTGGEHVQGKGQGTGTGYEHVQGKGQGIGTGDEHVQGKDTADTSPTSAVS